MSEEKDAYEIIDRNQLDEYRENYVCSKCWKPLGFSPVIGTNSKKWKVFCTNKNCDGRGFHRKYWVNRQRENDISDKIEADFNLRDILFPDRKKGTNEEILKRLGF